MTKNLKAILSLFLAISLLLSLFPTAFAEEEITPIESSDIARLPAGNSDGRLIEAGMTISYGNEETMKNAKYLVDGFCFSVPEVITYSSIDINQDTDSITVTTPDSQSAETGTISLTEDNNIIEFNYPEKKSIKRLELWIWPVGAIKKYELQYKNENDMWEQISEGSFDQTREADSSSTALGKAAVSYIVNFAEKETTGIRFVATEFKEGTAEAKIAEAVLRSNDNVNLLANDGAGNNLVSNSWLYNGNNGFVRQASLYAWKFGLSGIHTDTGIWWSIQDDDTRINAFPPQASSNASTARNIYPYTKNDVTHFWYGLSLSKSPQKVNKIAFNTAGTGKISQIEIYQSNLQSVTWPKLNAMPSGQGWKKVATVDCDIAAGDSVEIYLPYAEAAEHWIINISEWTETPQMCKPEFYVLGDTTDFPAISKAVYEIFDTLETDTDDAYIHKEITNLKSDYSDSNGNEYNVEWSFEADSEELLSKDGETLKIGFHETEETLVLSAKLTSKDGTAVSYTLSKEYTLLPVLNELQVTLSNRVEGDASVLSDGVYFSPYEIMKAPTDLPSDNYDKMIKVLSEGGYIDYNWLTPDSVSSLNLWIYPQGAVKDWEIQCSADGVSYNTIMAEGTFSEENISNSSAGCYSILFKEKSTKHIRFLVKTFHEGYENAYISEARPGKAKDIDYVEAIDGDEAYSHSMQGYVSSPVSGENAGASKSQTKVWPVKDGENLFIKPNNGLCWYATGFSVPTQKINRVIVPINSGEANMVELLAAAGNESGFDYENSDFPACPDTIAEYKTIATVCGEFSSSNKVTIDIPGGIDAKYLLIKISGATNETQIGRPSFVLTSEDSLSQTLLAANTIFEELTTDGNAANEIKKRINLLSSYTYGGKNYSVTYTSDNVLLSTQSGEVSYHDAQDTVTITAVIKESAGSSLSYSVSKKYTLLGMQSIYIQDQNGIDREIDCSSINDGFHYVNAESTAVPKYGLDTLVGLEAGDSIVFSWELAKSLTRFEMWNWPIDAILQYSIEVSEDGENWSEHYAGEIVDQFKDDPTKRPTLSAPESDYSNFYNIVFDKPTGSVRYIRFKVEALREGVDKAYILEAGFGETNNVNFLMEGTIKGSINDAKSNSKYVVGNRNSIIGAYAAYETHNWPRYSSGGAIPISPGKDGYIWYATSFTGAPVALNQVTLEVSAGTVYEYEVLYFKGYPVASTDAGFTWDRNNGQADPATLADYTIAARVSGEFTPGKASQIHFDNEFPAKYWLVRVTSASDDARLGAVGFYQLSKAELSTSCYNAVLDNVFEGIADTALSNVASEKLNLRSSIQMDANRDGNNETYFVDWSDDKGLINTDGASADYGCFNVGAEDVKIELSAHIYLSGETSKHVRRQNFILQGKDNRKLSTLITENNIVLSENSEKSYDSALGNGYEYEGKKLVEISFNKEASQNGHIQLVSKGKIIAEIPVTDGKLVYNGNEIELDSKILVETEDNLFSISKYGETDYELQLYKESFSEELSFEKIQFVTEASQSMMIDSLTIKVISEDLFNAVAEQFDFSKISPSYRATNLNENLSFVDTIADIELKVESGDSSVVEIDDENNIGIVKSGTTTITATLTNEEIGATHIKRFDVIAGKDNLAGVATATSPAVPTDGTSGVFALDGNLETEFLTGNKSWSVNINLLSEKSFNKLCVFLPKSASGKIESIKLLKSPDNIDYEEVCTVTEFEDGVDFEVPYTEAQFIRLELVSSGTKTGIRDICIYNDMTDTDKLEYDFEKLTENLAVENGTIIPKTGAFGTNFTLSSNNEAVTIGETEDKNSWKIVTGTVSADTNVTVTLSAKLGTLEPLTKPYSILLVGEIIIGDNTVSGDNNNGFGNGGLSGGGGGGGGSSKPPKEENTQNTQTSDSVLTAPSESIDELNNHWAESEIKTLIAKQIVTGDGSSLNLDKNVTRAEFCKMIVIGLGLEQINYQGSFSDVSEKEWFAPYAETALRNNIMSGDSNGFRGNETITRQEVAVVISNLLKNYFMHEDDSEKDTSASQTGFTDNNDISGWAIEQVALAAKTGILKGYETGDFKPLNSLKRDEAMVIVYRILSHIEK